MIMRMEKFVEEVLKGVTEKAGDTFNASITENLKNNGVKRKAIIMMSPENKVGSSIYLEELYAEYKNGGRGIDAIAGEVYQKLVEHMNDLEDVRLGDFQKWDVMKHRIYAKLVNFESNKELLKGKPYRKFLDLAVVYLARVEGLKDGGKGAFLVNDNYREVWRQTEESLYQTAASNMRLVGEAVFESMEKILCQKMPKIQFPSPASAPAQMYVLTNKEKIFGAAEILDSGTLKRVSDELRGDFIVLPSSVHECIIIPADETISYQKLADMVTEINVNAVSAEECLSDHVYLYERGEGVLKIAA